MKELPATNGPQAGRNRAPVGATQSEVDHFAQVFNQLLTNVERIVKGKQQQVAMALVCVLSEGHLLVEDVPGTGKTILAKSIAASIDGSWSRIQFTPDLLPSDVTGGLIYNQADRDFELHRGPVFSNIVLADEINRASPKTQSALLEVMAERQVTIGNTSNPVPRPFVVIATQNPIEQAGTYRLPEAQLDRFLMRLSLGHPDEEAELAVLAARPEPDALRCVCSVEDIRDLIDVASRVHVEGQIQRYIVHLAAASREHPAVRLGVSTRGALALQEASRVLAASQGREYVKVDDVKAVATEVMAHRLVLTPDAELKQLKATQIIGDILTAVAAPSPARAI